MFSHIGKLSLASLLLISASASATTTTTTAIFSSSSNNISINSAGNQIETKVNGIDVKLTGWADTLEPAKGQIDTVIKTANRFEEFNGGWALINQDEKNTSFSGSCSGHHAADNFNSCGTQDFDMFLIEFSEEVNLTGADYGWTYGNNSQVTVAALSNNSLNGNNWANVKANQTISSGWADAKTSTGSDFTTASANVSGTFSKYWLVGALNSVFGGSASNDAIKLASVDFTVAGSTTQPPTSVPEPTSIVMLGLALFGFAARRKIK